MIALVWIKWGTDGLQVALSLNGEEQASITITRPKVKGCVSLFIPEWLSSAMGISLCFWQVLLSLLLLRLPYTTIHHVDACTDKSRVYYAQARPARSRR